MLKRTKGRLLLTMLVITGLAGTLRNSSLTSQERKTALTSFKQTRSDLLKAVKGLSAAQLNFRPAPGEWSIGECINHITLTEKNLWTMLGAAMKAPATPERRADLAMADEDFFNMAGNPAMGTRTDWTHTGEPAWKTTAEALTAFKAARADHIKYAKSTTEDLRDHFVQLPSGWVDGYQLMLFVSAHCNKHILQINKIKADPAFPLQ